MGCCCTPLPLLSTAMLLDFTPSRQQLRQVYDSAMPVSTNGAHRSFWKRRAVSSCPTSGNIFKQTLDTSAASAFGMNLSKHAAETSAASGSNMLHGQKCRPWCSLMYSYKDVYLECVVCILMNTAEKLQSGQTPFSDFEVKATLRVECNHQCTKRRLLICAVVNTAEKMKPQERDNLQIGVQCLRFISMNSSCFFFIGEN